MLTPALFFLHRFWIRKFPMHFDLCVSLNSAILDFHQTLQDEGNAHLSKLVDTSKV